MAVLIKRLTLLEALGLSLAVVAPTVTAAFNITLVVGAAGPAAPLAFAIAALATVLIALSFMAFTHRVAHAGSAYAYITHTFGSRAGFVAGWALLLTYLGFGTGFAALVGSFTMAALQGIGISPAAGWWLAIGLVALLVAWWLAFQDMRLAGRVMLGLEAVAMAAIIFLCIAILRKVHPGSEQLAASFRPTPSFNGWVGLGFGMVFSMLSFAGFEGAATLGEETINPRRAIPVALLGSVILCAAFFVFVSYCEVVGFGPNGMHELANSEAPLDMLSRRYVSARLSIALDLAAATTCFSGAIGAIAAGGRVLYALGRVGLWRKLAEVHPVHGTPAPAIAVTALLIILPFLVWAPFAGAGNYYSYTSTTGALSLLLIYIGVGGAEVIEARREGRRWWAATCALGPLLLLWVLYCNVYPVPAFPNNLLPYITLAWVASALLVIRLRPELAAAPLPDYSPVSATPARAPRESA
ncbi:MAG TPA: APC family permease [Steroidobacteraceae bacterium]